MLSISTYQNSYSNYYNRCNSLKTFKNQAFTATPVDSFRKTVTKSHATQTEINKIKKTLVKNLKTMQENSLVKGSEPETYLIDATQFIKFITKESKNVRIQKIIDATNSKIKRVAGIVEFLEKITKNDELQTAKDFLKIEIKSSTINVTHLQEENRLMCQGPAPLSISGKPYTIVEQKSFKIKSAEAIEEMKAYIEEKYMEFNV